MSETISPHDKLVMVQCRLMACQPWYGAFALGMEWRQTDKIDTMGVRIVNGGIVECLYSPQFVMEHTLPELCSVVMHELEHIVRLLDSSPPDPKIGKKPECAFIPQGWPTDGTAEELYDRLLQEAKSIRKKKKGQKGQGGGGGDSDEGDDSNR